VLKLNKFGTFGDTHAKLVIELDITNNQFCNTLSKKQVRHKLDEEVIEEQQQEQSLDHVS
jgi:hypothetical protein